MKVATKWRWAIAILAVVFASEFLIGRYSPWFVAQVWYLRHRNGVAFMGKVIPVPRGMVGPWKKLPRRDTLSFEKTSPTMHGEKDQIEWGMVFSRDMLPHAVPGDAIRQLGMNLSALAPRLNGEVGPAFAVDTLEGKGWCYRMTFPLRNNFITKCLLFGAKWDVMYTGPPSHEKEFFRVIAGIHDTGQ